jgi:hypothetical protein
VLDGGKERPEILANKVLTMLKRAGQLCHACCMPRGGSCEPQSAKIGGHVLFVVCLAFSRSLRSIASASRRVVHFVEP